MDFRLNGKQQSLAAPLTVAELLERFALRRDGIAVEINRGIVPRSTYGERTIAEGDEIEIVTSVGGG